MYEVRDTFIFAHRKRGLVWCHLHCPAQGRQQLEWSTPLLSLRSLHASTLSEHGVHLPFQSDNEFPTSIPVIAHCSAPSWLRKDRPTLIPLSSFIVLVLNSTRFVTGFHEQRRRPVRSFGRTCTPAPQTQADVLPKVFFF